MEISLRRNPFACSLLMSIILPQQVYYRKYFIIVNEKHTQFISRFIRLMGKFTYSHIITEKIEQLEVRLNNLSSVNTEIKDLFKSGLKKIANLDIHYQKGNTEEKRRIISSMFPDFLFFDGTLHRTLRMNSAVELIYQDTNKLNGKKMGQIYLF